MDSQLASAVKWFGASLVVSSAILGYALTSSAVRLENALIKSATNLSSGASSAAARTQVQTLTLNGKLSLDTDVELKDGD